MKLVRVPVVFSTWWGARSGVESQDRALGLEKAALERRGGRTWTCLPARSWIHCLPSSQVLLSALHRGERQRGLGVRRAVGRTRERNAQEASLAAALDELVGLDDELVGEDPVRERRIGRDLVRLRVPRDLRRKQYKRVSSRCSGSGCGVGDEARAMGDDASDFDEARSAGLVRAAARLCAPSRRRSLSRSRRTSARSGTRRPPRHLDSALSAGPHPSEMLQKVGSRSTGGRDVQHERREREETDLGDLDLGRGEALARLDLGADGGSAGEVVGDEELGVELADRLQGVVQGQQGRAVGKWRRCRRPSDERERTLEAMV